MLLLFCEREKRKREKGEHKERDIRRETGRGKLFFGGEKASLLSRRENCKQKPI